MDRHPLRPRSRRKGGRVNLGELIDGKGRKALSASVLYARDVSEVLFLDRVRATAPQDRIAGEAATLVRMARFHAHARIPHLDLGEIVSQLSPDPISEIALPGPRPFHGVGSATYYAALASIVRAVKPKTVLEFGTYLGMGTLTIALNAPPDCRIVTVDLPDDADIGERHALNHADLSLIDLRTGRVGEAFVESRVADRITQVRADSLEWRAEEVVSSVDLVLVDGGHSRPVVTADTENALRVLAPNGTVLWDDYFHLYPDVVGYLDGLAAKGRVMRTIRGTNVVISNGRLR